MREFGYMAVTPPGHDDPSVAIAASRAGRIGVLDLAWSTDAGAARDAAELLARQSRNACGVRLGRQPGGFLREALAELPRTIRYIVLSANDPELLRRQIEAVPDRGERTLLLQVTSMAEARIGAEVGVDALIAKGHESAGRVGEETTFVLLQRLIARQDLPVWAQGGIGLHTVAACYVVGAAGAVLDGQLALTRESTLPESVKKAVARMDGSETTCLGRAVGETYRVFTQPRLECVARLAATEQRLAGEGPERIADWRAEIAAAAGWGDGKVWLLGQDAAFAESLARNWHTVAGVFRGMDEALEAQVESARTSLPLDENSPLARSHGTRFPVVQGPMTRVSDRAAFAASVAQAGGLPFLALALLRGDAVRTLLEETRDQLGSLPWGVGILGFVPLELRQQQLEAIRQIKPDYALIAGGRPDQAMALEKDGIPTYLHVPSPGLLKLFIQSGSRRFIFEGRECGGHVGPRSSFVLWNTMIDLLLETVPAGDFEDCHILFAGGIHDSLSSAMVAAMAAPLVERGAKVGVLIGTAYLFTHEAVSSGAIVEGFQQEAVRCDETVLLETGPGHATRCANTEFAEMFEREKRRLQVEGRSPDEVRDELEALNLGRLRIASKGITRGASPGDPRYVVVGDDEQHTEGMYMIGQVAGLRDAVCSVEELHREVAVGGSRRLSETSRPETPTFTTVEREQRPCDVAIVGMSCILPKAPGLRTYWNNILNKVDAITEIPAARWDWRQYFDADRRARDKIYSKWGGFLDDTAFDPMRYGMPPTTLPSIEPLQLLTLEVVRAGLEDAGYLDRSFPRQRTSVVLGAGGGVADLGNQYALRSALPRYLGDVDPEVWDSLPEWTEDSFAGILLNVAAGRVANRFDLGGLNCTVDAACASSLAAVYIAANELENGTSDMVLVGGVDTVQNPFGYLCFSKTQALSPRGRCRPFDAGADGISISEGLAVLVLRRLADAERDGDRIYGVIKAVASSSDGRDKGLTAPRPEGQMLAVERAYAKAGFSPATVGLIEAHGTGTVAGDRAEAETLTRVFQASGARKQGCAIGSVKSMIGHTKCTAGVAGLLKVAMGLHHKVLPPTLNVEQPNPKANFPESPFYVNSELRPWIRSSHETPRRAGVSAFGFGGTNFHVVVEEYADELPALARRPLAPDWPAELFVLRGATTADIAAEAERLAGDLSRGAAPAPCDLARALWRRAASRPTGGPTLALVAESLDDLRGKLEEAAQKLHAGETALWNPKGTYLTDAPLAPAGKLAFLFPGQGSQYPNMLRELAVHLPQVRETFERFDDALHGTLSQPLSRYVFPIPTFRPEDEKAQSRELTATNVAQPALGAADVALLHLLRGLGLDPQMLAGHSYGEYVALHAAGVFDEATLARLSEARGRCIVEAARDDLGTMAAVAASPEQVAPVVDACEGVWIANLNAPRQTVISGTRPGVAAAVERLKDAGLDARPIPVACAFHTPLIAPARDRFADVLARVDYRSPERAVYSNATAAPYPQDCAEAAEQLADHLVSPVRFSEQIEAMHRDGARIFVEVGPRSVLSGLTRQILAGKDHLAVAVDGNGTSGMRQLQHVLGQLVAHGATLDLDPLYAGRSTRELDLTRLVDQTKPPALGPQMWLVNGGGARPAHQPAGPGPRPRSRGTQKPSVPDAPQRPAPQPAVAAGAPVAPTAPIAAPAPAPASAVARQGNGASRAVPSVTPPSLGAAAAVTATPGNGSATPAVMDRYQHLMNRFLETQKNVMLAALGGAAAAETGAEFDVTRAGASVPAFVAPPSAPPEAPVVAAPAPAAPAPAAIETPRPAPAPTPSPAPVARAVAPDPAPAAQWSRERVEAKLLEIVGERTGYPAEMLRPELDLEAELGIDSIKRVEVLGAMQQACLAGRELASEEMERLTANKTLGSIVDWFVAQIAAQDPERSPEPAAAPAETAPAPADSTIDRSPSTASSLPRVRLAAIEAPPAEPSLELRSDRVVLITDDGGGVAEQLAERLESRGVPVALARPGTRTAQTGPARYDADLTGPEGVGELVRLVQECQGKLGGIVHLLPLIDAGRTEANDLSAWRLRLELEVKSLFHLIGSAGPALRESAASGAAWLFTATALGGDFGLGADGRDDFFAGHGGLCGLVKTLAVEWPEVQCKVVDCDVRDDASTLAGRILLEMQTSDGISEVGYRDARRLRPAPAPAEEGGQAAGVPVLDGDSVVLITGGARGITAEVAAELARRYRPTLILAGRSPLGEQDEAPETVGLVLPQELKSALIRSMSASGERPSLPEVERNYERLLKQREMRVNLAALERAGARVEYHPVDVRDEAAFGALIDAVYVKHGRLDGVIHGAGVIEDKLLDDKTPESFDRVFHTKGDSAWILADKLRPESLRFLVFFSSVAGAFANRGQADYAACNEITNKLALQLNGRWDARVVSINWGPWATTGMAGPEVQRQFRERGIEPIEVAAGRRALDLELWADPTSHPVIVVGSGPWEAMAAEVGAERAADSGAETSVVDDAGEGLPLLQGPIAWAGNAGAVEFIRTLDVRHDRLLVDHCLDGKPVLPAAMAMELMAEAAQHGWPELHVQGLRDLRVLKGVVLDKGPRRLRVMARAHVEPPHDRLGADVSVEIGDPDNPAHPLYRATVEMTDRLPEAPAFDETPGPEFRPFPMSVEEAYRHWLFHGPLFQNIVDFQGLAEDGMFASFVGSEPRACLAGAPTGRWLIDPVVFDSGLQLIILWNRAHRDMTPLPSRFHRYRRYGSLAGPGLRCRLRAKASQDGHLVHADLYFYRDGRLLGMLEQLECGSSKMLNRLAGHYDYRPAAREDRVRPAR